jgi:hypothetical protein
MVDSIALAAEERLSRLFDHVWLDPERPFISAARGHPLSADPTSRWRGLE